MSDWDTVTVLRKRPTKPINAKAPKVVNAAQRAGLAIETNKKFNAATNKQHQTTLNTAKLDSETENLHHDTVGNDVGKLIQRARQAKEWTQKDLATKICEKVQVVVEYEQGKAIPNQQIITKLERQLGIKLRGKEKGQPLEKKGGDKK